MDKKLIIEQDNDASFVDVQKLFDYNKEILVKLSSLQEPIEIRDGDELLGAILPKNIYKKLCDQIEVDTNKKLKILLVDDTRLILSTAKRYLNKLQFHDIKQSMDLDDGYKLFKEYNPDMVILDIVMPETQKFESGIDLLQTIKKEKKNTIVIMLTGSSKRETIVRCLSNGANAYLLKPFNFDRLKETLNSLL